jgi:phosphate/sulfate permease
MGGEYAGDRPQFKSTTPTEAHFTACWRHPARQLWTDILLAWALTLPVTIAVAAGLFYVLEG